MAVECNTLFSENASRQGEGSPAGYKSTFLLNHSPGIHTRLDSHTHHLVAEALAPGEQGGSVASPGFTLWSPSTNPVGEELLRGI